MYGHSVLWEQVVQFRRLINNYSEKRGDVVTLAASGGGCEKQCILDIIQR